MAKRRRLDPAPRADGPGQGAPRGPLAPLAPIAEVAGQASAHAALAELGAEMDAARSEGRLVALLPLDAVEAGHIARDRIAADDEAQAALRASLTARGQQMPIEVVETAPGRYGLISGWRRLATLRALHAETGEERFATVKALIRTIETDPDAYLAMVEENEIRADLGIYERARIAAIAAERGVFEDARAAVSALFANASRAKRSKINSFVAIHESLGDVLRFPAALPERLGLRVAKTLADGQGQALRAALAAADPADAAAEQTVLSNAISGAVPEAPSRALAGPKSGSNPPVRDENGTRVTATRRGGTLVLSGPGVTPDFEAALRAWLADRG